MSYKVLYLIHEKTHELLSDMYILQGVSHMFIFFKIVNFTISFEMKILENSVFLYAAPTSRNKLNKYC